MITNSPLLLAIYGTILGDTLGLPAEGLTPRRISQLQWTSPLRQRFILGRGMWSDDTDHTLLLTEAVIQSNGDVSKFKRLFSNRLRFWINTMPPGVGFATLRSVFLQSIGLPLHKTGIYSAGNGPSMRAAVLGALYPDNATLRQAYNEAQTTLTHSDPKALFASSLVVEVAASFTSGESNIRPLLEAPSDSEEWNTLRSNILQALDNQLSLPDALTLLNIPVDKGISGYSYHTVPAAIYIGMRHRWDLESTLTTIISCGGDTDTVGAIAGALCALHPEAAPLPKDWLINLAEWPTSQKSIESSCQKISQGHRAKFFHWYLAPLYALRNLRQLAVIFLHIALRCLPPKLGRLLVK